MLPFPSHGGRQDRKIKWLAVPIARDRHAKYLHTGFEISRYLSTLRRFPATKRNGNPISLVASQKA
jgi:hypothetical protein